MTSSYFNLKSIARFYLTAAAVALSSELATAQTVAPAFSSRYSLVNLGAVPGVPTNYGGLTVMEGNTNTLLIGGNANFSTGGIYAIGVVRGVGGHITGFSGTATLFATAPNIDGGLAYGPGGVLFYTSYPTNTIGEIKPGSVVADKTASLSAVGVSSSAGALGFVPGTGALKVSSWSTGGFYNVPLSADGTGTYNLAPATLTASSLSGPEGFIYPSPSSPLFAAPSMLLSEYNNNRVSAFQVDSNGNPLAGSRQDFITSLSLAEGATFDPVTGDALFSTFGSSVVEVRGFSAVPEPSSVGLALCGGVVCAIVRRRRAKITRSNDRPTAQRCA
jgi:hypothetical protein